MLCRVDNFLGPVDWGSCSITSLDSVQRERQEHIRVGKMIIIHFDEGNFGR